MRGISEERLREIAKQTHDSDDTNYMVLSLLDYLLSECKELNPWLPIENAPKDRLILIYDGKFARIGFWADDNQAFLDEWGNGIVAKLYQKLPDDPV